MATKKETSVAAAVVQDDALAEDCGEDIATVYDRHAAAVLRYALSRGLTIDDARDVTHDVFVIAFQKARSIRLVGGSLLPWLLVTCRNLVHAKHRERARERPLPSDELNAGSTVGADTVAERNELADAVAAAVANLPVIDQQLVELCLEQKLSYAKAAKVLGVSHGTVRNRLSRARIRLQPELQPVKGNQQ